MKKRVWRQIEKKIQKWLTTLKARGNERLTLMIIPHNEAHIFSLQLSKFAILYALLIMLTIMVTSGFSVRLQQNIREEAAELYLAENAYQEEREKYMQHYRRLRRFHEGFRENLQVLLTNSELSLDEEILYREDRELNKLAEEGLMRESQALLRLWQTAHEEQQSGGLLEKKFLLKEEKLPEKITYGSEVRQFRKLHLALKDTLGVLRFFRNFVKERETVQRSLPYFWPLAGGHFTSFYGPRLSPFGYARDFHTGIDLADEIGTPVYAAADGYVTMSGYNGGYGIHIRLQHRFGYQTLYGHLSASYVYPGQVVKKGQMIGRLGSTGRSTGPHLHYEVRLLDRHLDPLPYLTSL
ncbi:MAG: M23 family metallopeptidase [Leptospiraceae bacterium]|nr:M23 family metallopeptidase [Leptospiraceae bacterium]MDW8305851.1 M23 family metallopeptidase [Leptospiraceae bacterium]